uniref:PET117 cytochrome c oxidase chaperone n=1 Tax=Spermophilus dauricus TaxID=99837 RepID=A0A8C9P5B9_SPEDA
VERSKKLNSDYCFLTGVYHIPDTHVQYSWRLRDGVIRDIERQNRKKENIRLLGEQIILTEQLEAEREKMLLEKGSQKT